jgi:chromosome segregation ATPase
MKLSCNLFWISAYVGAASAFTSNLAGVANHRLQLKGPPKHSMTLSAKKSPLPPDYSPRVDEQLELDLMESERRIDLYEMEVKMIREQLGLKQNELLEEQNLFRDEKRNLMGKISEFTSILAQRDKELENALDQDQKNEADLAKQAELENTIKSLETQLQEKTNALENEIESGNELQKRFGDAEDALEYEQMNFEKERNLLQELVVNERKQVKILQEKFDADGKSFDTTREELLSKIKNEEEKLSDTKAKWSATQEQLQKVEEKLQISLQEKSRLLKDNKTDIDAEKAAMPDEIVSLQNEIKNQQADMEALKSELLKGSPEYKIETEERMIKELKQELADEQQKYESEKSALGQEIKSITANLADVESELAEERANFSEEKEMLEKKLANEIRVGRLKKKQMKRRYDEIRREMTDLWESSKRQARKEESRLRKKYKSKLEIVQAQVSKLEDDLTSEKERVLATQKNMQSKHAEELKTRDATIVELEGNVATLGKLIADKDQIIEEKNQRIQRYETSFRQVAKLGFKVTGNKIKRVARPLKRLIQNSPPSELVE